MFDVLPRAHWLDCEDQVGVTHPIVKTRVREREKNKNGTFNPEKFKFKKRRTLLTYIVNTLYTKMHIVAALGVYLLHCWARF